MPGTAREGFDMEFMQIMVALECYEELAGQLAPKHIRDWTVEEPEEPERFANKD